MTYIFKVEFSLGYFKVKMIIMITDNKWLTSVHFVFLSLYLLGKSLMKVNK